MPFDDLPAMLTIAEAAKLLRISRTTAYALAKEYLATGNGLPVVRIGGSLRVPRELLLPYLMGTKSLESAA